MRGRGERKKKILVTTIAPPGDSPAPDPPSYPGRMVDTNSTTSAFLRHAGLIATDVPGEGPRVTMAEAQAEAARRGIVVAMPEPLPPLGAEEARAYVDLMQTMLGAHLMRLQSGSKRPVESAWPEAPAPSVEEATAWLERDDNVAINLRESGENGWAVLDAENAAATALLMSAGLVPTAVTANAQDPTSPKRGGAHFWFALPPGVDPDTLRATLQVPLPGGGLLDVLVSTRYAVAPGSRLDCAPGYRYGFAAGGAASEPERWSYVPDWLLDPDAPAPDVPGIEVLRGIMLRRERRRKRPARDGADRITAQVDDIGWDEWLDGDPRVQILGVDGSCGCDVFHWAGASTQRSGILHDGCEYGCGVHIFSGTLCSQIGTDHASRLDFAAWLRGLSVAETASRFGISLRDELAGVEIPTSAAVEAAATAVEASDPHRAEAIRAGGAMLRALAPSVSAGAAGPPATAGPAPELHVIAGGADTADAPRPSLSAVPPIGSVSGACAAAIKSEPEPSPDDDLDELAVAVAQGRLDREADRCVLAWELKSWLLALDKPLVELGALLDLTPSERREVVNAAKSGLISRLDLTPKALHPETKGSRGAWVRLREGSAAPWTLADLPRLSDAELAAALNAEPPVASLGGGLFYTRGVHNLAGPPGCGKTMLALQLCVSVVPAVPIGDARVRAVYLDFDRNLTLLPRLVTLGLSAAALKRREVSLINVPELAHTRKQAILATLRSIVDGLAAAEEPPQVVVIDSMSRVMAETLESSNDTDAVTRLLNRLGELSERCCLVILDHTGHGDDKRPSGSMAKLGATQAVLTLQPTSPNTEDYPNTVKAAWVVSAKDRDGGINRHARADDRSPAPRVGLMTLDGSNEAGITAVRFIPESVMEAAQERRESAAGRGFAAEARRLILQLVDTAARAAVRKSAAAAAGTVIVPPLSMTGACKLAWEQLQGRGDGKRSDVRAAGQQLLAAGALVVYHAEWGRGVSGSLRVRGGLSGLDLDPVDLDALAAAVSASVDRDTNHDTDANDHDTKGTVE